MSVLCSDRCSFFLSIFYPWLVEALAAEPRDMEGQLYWFKADKVTLMPKQISPSIEHFTVMSLLYPTLKFLLFIILA